MKKSLGFDLEKVELVDPEKIGLLYTLFL